METSLPKTVAKTMRVLPRWMLESTNQQQAHTTTVSSHKKQKRRDIIDSFYGPPIKHRVPLQDLSNNKKRRLEYLKEKQREHRSKESQEDKIKRLRKMREYAQRARSIHNESADHREARLSDQRHRSQRRVNNESEAQRQERLADLSERSQQQCASESEAEREERLLDLRERDHERRASESEEQRAQRNQIMREYRRELLANQAQRPPAPSPESIRQQQLSRKDLEKFQKEIRLSPTSICCTCERLCYPKGVSLVDVSKDTEAFQSPHLGSQDYIVHRSFTGEILFYAKHSSGKLARWSQAVSEYNLEIHYHPGRQNANVDAMSQSPLQANMESSSLETIQIATITPSDEEKEYAKLLQEDPKLKRVLISLNGKDKQNDFVLANDILYYCGGKPLRLCSFSKKETPLKPARSGSFAGRFSGKQSITHWLRNIGGKGCIGMLSLSL
uniref:STPR domain-containing protein n=1 Tax=Amphimedon queenslandica TaxID=400682 RepID=A0A1X7UBB0_AMPQE